MSEITFAGTAEQQSLAEEVFRLMVAQGRFFADDAPIRQTLSNLADFLAHLHQKEHAAMAAAIDAAIQENQQIFIREAGESDVIYTTSRLGMYHPRQDVNTHTYKQRLYNPEKPLPVDDISVVISTSRPVLTTVEPVFISDYWQQSPTHSTAHDLTEREPREDKVGAAPPTDLPAPTTLAEVALSDAEAEVGPPLPAEPVSTVNTVFTLPDGTTIDLSQPTPDLLQTHRHALAAALLYQIDNDPLNRLVRFGTLIYAGDNLPTLGKNDLRRIRDDIIEAGRPLLDATIIDDLYHSQRQADYEGFRFALNYRLSREKDFEYVGVPGANLWAAKGLPAIGTKRVKAAEMAQLTGYLPDGFDDSLEDQSLEAIQEQGEVSRFLTFFEWTYGVLPFDAALAALLPRPVLNDQRSAVLTFESPQHFTSYVVEVRYPTGNRGGWLQGLEEFFHDYLVAGALFTIARTALPNVFTIRYDEASEASERLLTLDEKKNKFGFTEISYFCMVDETRLLAQNVYGKFRNLKALPMSDRRKGDVVLHHIFEVLGANLGTRTEPRYQIDLDTVVLAFTVLRPASRPYVLDLIERDPAIVAADRGPNLFIYTPEREETSDADADEEDSAYSAWKYDDDDE